ncbi:MAG: hypothetical protein GYA45_11730 [Pelolinea sp.]|nr:hypothetical protein [Pelolinea sp.]
MQDHWSFVEAQGALPECTLSIDQGPALRAGNAGEGKSEIMSIGNRISLASGKRLAEMVVNHLKPDCERIEIAGSIRRRAETVGDIEIVLIPRKVPIDLFGNEEFGHQRIEDVLSASGYMFSKRGMYFKQARLPSSDVIVDLFLTTPEKWGVVFTLRTGSAWFSHKLVTKKREGGMCPSNIDFVDGRLWRSGLILETPEEEDVFRELGLEWIAPEKRN